MNSASTLNHDCANERSFYFNPMSKGYKTRERIVSTALVRATRDGIGAVTLGSAATELAMSKSGLFAHFGSKDALQLAIVEMAVDRFCRKVIEPALRHQKPRERLSALIDANVDWIDGDDDLSGCPFASAVQEFRERPGAVRHTLVEAQKAWRLLLATTVADAQNDGSVRRDVPPEQIVFEIVGILHSYQFARAVLGENQVLPRVAEAIRHILDQD